MYPIILSIIGEYRVSLAHRISAKVIDLVFVILLAAILPYPIGPFLGFTYSLLCDGFRFGPFKSQSIGKRVFGLTVKRKGSKAPVMFKESALRNAPVGVATFFAIIPVWGWIILILVGVPLMALEIYLMMKSGIRLGDVMGETEVEPVVTPSQ